MLGTTCPTEQELRAFQLGDLPEALLNAVAEHLEGCAECEERARKLDSAVDSVLEFIRDPSTVHRGPGSTWIVPSAGPASAETRPSVPAGTLKYPFLRPAVQPDEFGRLGNYRVLGLLGAGGMAYVFRAEDIALRRPVALKVMKPELGREEGWQRFFREARLLAGIKHDHLVTVYQAGQEGHAVYLAMELLHGESLESWISRQERIAEAEIIRLAKAIAAGLAVVHRHGIIHRDIKPANIWLEAPSRQVKILDFGLARVTHDDANLTQVGTIMGTPSFMSPEQARGDPADARSDLFSLGCVLYCLAAGSKPFRADNTLAALTALAVDNPRPIHELNADVSRPLADLIMQLLAKNPEERPTSAAAVLERLEQIEAGAELPTPRVDWRRRGVRSALLVGVGIASLLVGLMIRSVLTQPGANQVDPSQQTAALDIDWPRANESGTYLTDLKPIEQVNWLPSVPRPPKGGGDKGPKGDGGKGPKGEDGKGPKGEGGKGPKGEDGKGPKGEGGKGPKGEDGKGPKGEGGKGPKGEGGKGPPPEGDIPVEIKGKRSPHGIFMHAVPGHLGGGPSSISYRLGKQYRTFYALVSLNDGPPLSDLPLTFTVYGDGKQLWQSTPVESQDNTQRIEVSVQGVEVLKIQLDTPPGHVKGTHGVWIEPFLAK